MRDPYSMKMRWSPPERGRCVEDRKFRGRIFLAPRLGWKDPTQEHTMRTTSLSLAHLAPPHALLTALISLLLSLTLPRSLRPEPGWTPDRTAVGHPVRFALE